MNKLMGLAVFMVLAGCSTTTAILLPDDDGKVGALVLKHGDSAQVVEQPYTAASAGGMAQSVSTSALTHEAVERQYGGTLQAQPAAAVSFVLYFHEGTVELTEESRAQLALVVVAFKARTPAKVFIIGHTDRIGNDSFNMQLGLERARLVEQQLRSVSAELNSIEVRSFGENDPLVKTADDVAAPRNRRVEILIL